MRPPRPEYPRPTLVREDWISLNGTWEFDFDDTNVGMDQQWYLNRKLTRSIVVPFPFQSDLSGIGDRGFHDVVWYRRVFDVPDGFRGRRMLLHFGAVDYLAAIWLNGEPIGQHRGGYVPFNCDITDIVRRNGNVLVLRVEDTQSPEQPRGKQSVALNSSGCTYTRTTGIWQTVWLEPVSPHYIQHVRCTPDVDEGRVEVTAKLSGRTDRTRLHVAVSFGGQRETEVHLGVAADDVQFTIGLKAPRLWSPEAPNLYDLLLELVEDGSVVDRALVYFGLRKVEVSGSHIKLNGKPLYQRLVLDQGFWPDGIYTAPNDDAFKADIELAKALGFNGVRMHQKIADPRYLYWADHLGLLVWAEMPACFEFTDAAVANFAREWPQLIRRDYNHPCIIAWVPFNETWGIAGVKDSSRQQEFVGEIAAMTRSLDTTRLVVDNSGWEHLDTDIVDIHDYTGDAAELARRLKPLKLDKLNLGDRKVMVDGVQYSGQPVIVSEYGGISLQSVREGDWGYGKAAASTRELVRRYRELTNVLLASKSLAGFCYTQLYDIEQETNGLATYDRKPKVKPATIAAINTGRALAAKRPAKPGGK